MQPLARMRCMWLAEVGCAMAYVLLVFRVLLCNHFLSFHLVTYTYALKAYTSTNNSVFRQVEPRVQKTCSASAYW